MKWNDEAKNDEQKEGSLAVKDAEERINRFQGTRGKEEGKKLELKSHSRLVVNESTQEGNKHDEITMKLDFRCHDTGTPCSI